MNDTNVTQFGSAVKIAGKPMIAKSAKVGNPAKVIDPLTHAAAIKREKDEAKAKSPEGLNAKGLANARKLEREAAKANKPAKEPKAKKVKAPAVPQGDFVLNANNVYEYDLPVSAKAVEMTAVFIEKQGFQCLIQFANGKAYLNKEVTRPVKNWIAIYLKGWMDAESFRK